MTSVTPLRATANLGSGGTHDINAKRGLFTATIVLLIAALATLSIAGLALAAGLRRGDRMIDERYARRWAAQAIAEKTLYELETTASWRGWSHVERREIWDNQTAVVITTATVRTNEAALDCFNRIGVRPRSDASLMLLAGVADAGTFRVETATEYTRAPDGAATVLQRKRIGGQEAELCRLK